MVLEAVLAYLHFMAILTMAVFITSEAALCRAEWMNASIVRRLVAADRIYLGAALAVLLTGIARTYWGLKGWDWYWSQPLLHVKVGLFALMLLLAIGPSRAFRRWRRALDARAGLPPEPELRRVRLRIMVSAHLMLFIPAAAVMLAKGVLTR